MRILCLHGYTQSASLFAKKSSGLRKKLVKAGHELVFIDGPLKIEISELPFEPSPDMEGADMRGWWNVNEASKDYSNVEPALETVKQAVETQGPFDGILGFSQGAGLTAILTKALPDLVPSHPPLKFAIIYSGFVLKAERNQHWYTTNFSTPALHVMGTLDTLVANERSEALVERWEQDKASVLKHPGGHYMPSQRPMVDAVLGFIEKLDQPLATANEEENWDEFDKIGK